MTTQAACVVEVVRTVSTRGAGTEGDVVRRVVTYWSLKGEWLAENDPVFIQRTGVQSGVEPTHD